MLLTTMLTAGLLAAGLGGPGSPGGSHITKKAAPPPIQGTWTLAPSASGHAEGTLIFSGTRLVFVDHDVTFLGVFTVTRSKPTKVGMRHEGYVDLTVTHPEVGVARVHPAERSWITWEDDGKVGRTCATRPGGKATQAPPLTGRATKELRCWATRKAPLASALRPKRAPGACVTECVSRNQMRAVGPEVIEADCRKRCAAKK